MMHTRPKRNLHLLAAALLLAATALAFGPCQSAKRGAPPPGRSLADGESIGKIDAKSDSTALAAKVHSLIAVECRGGHLYIRTSVENLDATMQCADLPPRPALEPYFAKQVSITYSGGQVLIENDTVGKLALKATDPRVTEVNATPGP